MSATKRELGTSEILVAPVALGCWPISGMTSLDVNDSDSRQTIQAAIRAGINHLDTAYCYGASGESERLIGEVIAKSQNELIIATKGGVHWTNTLERVVDGRPETLQRECDESLARLGLDQLDLLYLHAPDPKIDIRLSAQALAGLVDCGKTKLVGVSNVDLAQLQAFAQACKPSVVQLPFNMLQQSIKKEIVPWCIEHDVSIAAYWPLMKGLLGGQLRRQHVFNRNDKRLTYPMFQGEQWQRNQDFVDELDEIANSHNTSIAALVVAWTIAQPGIAMALCGAKRNWQIEESAQAMNLRLNAATLDRIEQAIERRVATGIAGY